MENQLQRGAAGYIKGIFGTIFLFILSNIPLTVFIVLNTDKKPFSLAENAVVLGLMVACIGLSFYYLAKKNVLWMDLAWVNKSNLLLFIVGYVAIFASTKLLAALGMNSTSNGNAIMDSLNGSNTVLFIALITIVAPILEECVYRGGIMGIVFSSKPLLGVFATSILFCLAHTPDSLLAFANYFISGFIFAFIYYRSRRLEVGMALHLFNNAVALIMVSLGFN